MILILNFIDLCNSIYAFMNFATKNIRRDEEFEVDFGLSTWSTGGEQLLVAQVLSAFSTIPWFGLSIDVSLLSAAGSNICIFCVLSRGGELCSFWLSCEDEDERRRRQQELAGDEELSSLPGVVTTNHQDRGNKFL